MSTYSKAGNPDDIALGRGLISAGKVGCIVLAGGDGSRLGWKGPKGTFPLSLVRQKTLFQLLAERVEAASEIFGRKLPVAIMTSPLNHEATKRALPSHFDLFDQEMVPLIDLEGRALAEKRPNGNGDVLRRFCDVGLYDKWRDLGVEYLQIILIDNPLAEPFDPNQIGIHFKKGAEISLKAIKKQNEGEKVGVIGHKEGKVTIIEYSQSPPKQWALANTSLFCFSMPFAQKARALDLTAHRVKKVIDGRPVYKTERFIFDLLPHASKVEIILYERSATFAPLKERKDVGPVQRALLDRDRRVFQQLTGHPPHDGIFELDAAFHYPTEEIASRWRGRPHPGTPFLIP